MSEPDPQKGRSDDFYETAFVFLVRSLRTLEKDAVSQCVEMEYCNVAWFIKDDFLRRVNILMNEPNMDLSKNIIRDLCILTSLVGSVPCKLTDAGNHKADQEISMRDDCWQPVRVKAQALLESLECEINRVDKILWGDADCS